MSHSGVQKYICNKKKILKVLKSRVEQKIMDTLCAFDWRNIFSWVMRIYFLHTLRFAYNSQTICGTILKERHTFISTACNYWR